MSGLGSVGAGGRWIDALELGLGVGRVDRIVGDQRFRELAVDGVPAGELVDVDPAGADAIAVGHLGGAEMSALGPPGPAAPVARPS